MQKHLGKEDTMANTVIVDTDGKETWILDEDGNEADRFESCGCVYKDLGACGGCYVCKLRGEPYDSEPF